MTPLERAIDSLSDRSVAIADALRGLLVVSRRISATDLTAWIKAELDGYDAGQEVPTYRHGGSLPVKIRFDGPMGVNVTRMLSRGDLPEALAAGMGDVVLHQPIAELHALAQGDSDPQMQLSNQWLALYRHYAHRGEAPHMEMMEANHVAIAMPCTYLLGIVDRVKSTALDMALSLEDVTLDAGSAGGPTVESEPRLQEAVTHVMHTIYAINSSVVVANNSTVSSVVQVGDVAGLLEAARGLLTDEGVEALAEALDADGGTPAEATRSMIERVKGGAYVLGGGLATNGAYDGLVELLKAVFPGFS